MRFNSKKALILAPHTDDGEFGCGGTIARLLEEGCQVKYVAFSDCRESVPDGFPKDILRHELAAATSILGLKTEDVTILDYKVRYFSRDRQAILEDLVKINREFNPDLVLTPRRQDIHQDHQTITNEAMRAFKTTTLLGYELPWNNLSLPSDVIISISEDHLNRKIEAIQAYKSQSKRVYSDKDYIQALAKTRGARVGVSYAEAFDGIRWIIR